MRNNDAIKSSYNVIEVPICTGSPTRGSEYAYRALRDNGIAECFDDNVSFSDCSVDLHFDAEYPDNLKFLSTVVRASEYLKSTVVETVSEGKFPIIIGGDHSIALGSIAAISELYGAENIAVVYIDAHPDINTDKSTLTGYIHGMPLAASLGLCCDQLSIGGPGRKIFGENIHIIGARSIDDAEMPIIRSEFVDLVTYDEFSSKGIETVLKDLLPKLGGKKVHISFDVDSLDPSEFSSTGYLIPNGLTVAEVSAIISAVSSTADVVSFECVEYNPMLDKSGEDLTKLMKIFSCFYKSINNKR